MRFWYSRLARRHRAVGLVVRVGEQLLRAGPHVGEDALGFVGRVGDRALGLGVRAGDRLPRLLAGGVDQVVALVEDVLGVVDLRGQRVADVVKEFEHVSPGHDAAGRHRDAARLLDDGHELVERLENPVHGNSNPLSLCPVCPHRAPKR